jgi:hypothetical protein
MKADRLEFTFLVRMWQPHGKADAQWRGSVHEVSSGKRRFITGTHDVTEFIESYLRDESRAQP